MYSALAAGLDVPQTVPPVLPSVDQFVMFEQVNPPSTGLCVSRAGTAEWYEGQQPTSLPPNGRRLAESVLSPPHSYEQARPNRDFTKELRSLQKYYTILDSNQLIIQVLEEESALYALLVEAVSPLKNAFGEKWIVQVRVQFSEDDRLVKVAVQLPACFVADPESVLRSFDEEWWLNNCHRSGGALVFDYEIQDGV